MLQLGMLVGLDPNLFTDIVITLFVTGCVASALLSLFFSTRQVMIIAGVAFISGLVFSLLGDAFPVSLILPLFFFPGWFLVLLLKKLFLHIYRRKR